jgi:signal recognition particle receptor subunit beta
LVIAAHKADLIKPTAGGPAPAQLAANRVRSVLERELERRRAALVGVEDALGGLDGGAPGQPFRFADWDGGEVAFVGTWATPGQQKAEGESEKAPADGLAELRSWLEEL